MQLHCPYFDAGDFVTVARTHEALDRIFRQFITPATIFNEIHERRMNALGPLVIHRLNIITCHATKIVAFNSSVFINALSENGVALHVLIRYKKIVNADVVDVNCKVGAVEDG
ncbi:hypothetical protein DF142_33375 [Burkholderia cenocepacia]|nr:hypothetical protein DF142_33375 [Burkholderia cenocepacia]RQU60843.1 hypothetical protein DF140_28120 [Burkholderia cenocepacia]